MVRPEWAASAWPAWCSMLFSMLLSSNRRGGALQRYSVRAHTEGPWLDGAVLCKLP